MPGDGCFLLLAIAWLFLQNVHNLWELFIRPPNKKCLVFQGHADADIQLLGDLLILTFVAGLSWCSASGVDMIRLRARAVAYLKCILLKHIEPPHNLRLERIPCVEIYKRLIVPLEDRILFQPKTVEASRRSMR